jgi:hypothetical protein
MRPGASGIPSRVLRSRSTQSERSLLERWAEHLRHARGRLLQDIPLRAPLVRGLPRRRARRGAHVLHRPRLLVPVPLLSLPRVERPAPQPERRAGLRAESTEDGVLDLAVRPQQRCGPAGGRDAVRALADGRRPAGGSGPRGARSAGRRPLRPRRTRRRSAARPVPSRHRRPRRARRRQAGDGDDSAPFRDRRGRPGRAARGDGRRRPRPAEVSGDRHGRHRASRSRPQLRACASPFAPPSSRRRCRASSARRSRLQPATASA